MLSMLKPETISKYQQMGKFAQQHARMEEYEGDPHRMTQIEEEYNKNLSKTHQDFFSSSGEGSKRPNTASNLPHIPKK